MSRQNQQENEMMVAITLALHQHTSSGAHDTEQRVLTFRKVAHDYSPWSAKHLSMRQFKR
jgi:hypothetical protein